MYIGDCLGGIRGRGGERKGYRGVKRMEVHYIYTYEDSAMKLTKCCLKEEGEGEWEHNRE
jgi:hypothetical protein